ncbi:unnamed protein product [Calypogeia fissa]
MDRNPRNFWSPSSSEKVPRISPLNTLQDGERCLPLGDLLPGIRNELTLKEIATKLSWKDFHVLSSVSRGWRHAIRSREVYNERVRWQTRETVALILYGSHPDPYQLALYSMRDGSSYLVPPIPGFEGGIPTCSRCVSVDGRLFVIGGLRDPSKTHEGEVYVLDLAGQIGWKRCASMREVEGDFKSGVLHGKIYVFGMFVGEYNLCGEVYDQKTNTWSSIRTPIRGDVDYQVESLGEEIFLFGVPWDVDPGFWAYHPVKKEWREVNLEYREDLLPFTAQGKWHVMCSDDIFVHDAKKNSWIELPTFAFAGNINPDFVEGPICVQAVKEELLALWDFTVEENDSRLFQSKGFCSDAKKILWEGPLLDFAADCIKSYGCSLSTVEL